MRCRIGVVIGLDLDDPAADAVEQQRRADQLGRDLMDAAGEELAAELLNHISMFARAADGQNCKCP